MSTSLLTVATATATATTTGNLVASTTTPTLAAVTTFVEGVLNLRFSNDVFAGLSHVNAGIFLGSLLVFSILGMSRLLAIPMIASMCGAIDNGLEWYVYSSSYPKVNKSAAIIFADLAWLTQDLILTLYSFFLLEKILKGTQRTVFIMVFSFLFLAVVGQRLAVLVLHYKALWDDSIYVTVSLIIRGYFSTLALLEVISVVYLLRTFYKARKRSNEAGTKHVGLFTQLAHSSEVRVATLASIGITRAICFPFNDSVHGGFDRAAYILENVFPVFLLFDLMATRLVKLESTVEGLTSGNSFNSGSDGRYEQRSSGVPSSGDLGSPTGKGPVESITRDFSMYMGKGWSRGMSVSSGVAPSSVSPGVQMVEEVREEEEGADKKSKMG